MNSCSFQRYRPLSVKASSNFLTHLLYHTVQYSTVPYCTFLHTYFLLLNESILIRNEFIPIWYEFILSQCMYFTKSVLEQLRITLDKKFFWGLIVIKKCDFLKLFLHLNSEVWDAIWVWIHSNVEGIHTSFAWIHSTCEGIQTETGIPLLFYLYLSWMLCLSFGQNLLIRGQLMTLWCQQVFI